MSDNNNKTGLEEQKKNQNWLTHFATLSPTKKERIDDPLLAGTSYYPSNTMQRMNTNALQKL